MKKGVTRGGCMMIEKSNMRTSMEEDGENENSSVKEEITKFEFLV